MSPKPGDIGFTKIGGILGFFVHLGQWFNGDRSQWTHVFVVLPDNQIVEAQPGGARVIPLSDYDDRDTAFASPDLSQEQRTRIADEALKLAGTPYSYADYAALFVRRVGLCRGFLRKYVRNSGRMICSQAADEAYRRAGIHLFDDGRLPQDVTPGDLAKLFKLG